MPPFPSGFPQVMRLRKTFDGTSVTRRQVVQTALFVPEVTLRWARTADTVLGFIGGRTSAPLPNRSPKRGSGRHENGQFVDKTTAEVVNTRSLGCQSRRDPDNLRDALDP